MRPTQYEAALAAMTAWLSHPQELGQGPGSGYGRSLPVAAGCRALAVWVCTPGARFAKCVHRYSSRKGPLCHLSALHGLGNARKSEIIS